MSYELRIILTAALVLAGCAEEPSGSGRAADGTATSAAPVTAEYMGGESCRECHQKEWDRWVGSHHDLAMQPADSSTVLGDFDDATFEHYGVTSSFSRRDGAFVVRTEGPDGEMVDYEVAYTFGVDPLQQYLVAFPDGRLQTLPLCWDTRPAEDGGQRWFHIYPDEHIPPGDLLYWTGLAQNWNHMCADCHSTNVHKGYVAAEDRFETTWSEIDVSCEACHGPGSAHDEWARQPEPTGDPRLVSLLRDPQEAVWIIDPETGNAKRVRLEAEGWTPVPRTSREELETCARCHSRRATIREDWRPDEPLLDTHRPALLAETLYWADGQIKDEVYVWGSFLQSKMYAEGVTCTDCHDPHRGDVILEGNALCGQCHLSTKYDVPEHHFHKPDSTGAACVECHMPDRNYMVVDPRRDHSLRIPRPDLSLTLGTPNACNDCHADRSIEWAAEAAAKWWGTEYLTEHWAETIHAARTWQAGAGERLIRLATDASAPAIVRATALSLLPRDAGAQASAAIQVALNDEDPLPRFAALALLASVDPMPRMQIGYRHLSDPRLAVRMEAASVLASVPPGLLAAEQRTKLDEALAEYRTVQHLNANRPEAHLNLGALRAARGELDAAIQQYRVALALLPSFGPAWVNLADAYRAQGHEAEAERKLRAALEQVTEPADVHLALGLTLVRRQRHAEALEQFRLAVESNPEEPYYRYVRAVALDSAGEKAAARDVLDEAHDRFPGHPDIAAFRRALQNGG